MAGHPRDHEFIEFDEGNESELAAHGIVPLEVMQMMRNGVRWAPNKKGRAGLWLAVGVTDGGRLLSVPCHYDDALRRLRPITGWDTTAGERTTYRKGR